MTNWRGRIYHWEALGKAMVQVPMGWFESSSRYSGDAQFKVYELFMPGVVHEMFWVVVDHESTETKERKILDKGALLSTVLCRT